jgi:hypothetical protein
VPVHVIGPRLGPRRRVLRRLLDHGFQSGLEPRLPSIGAMHALVPMLLDAFDEPDGSAEPGEEGYRDTLNGSRVPASASASRPPSVGRP